MPPTSRARSSWNWHFITPSNPCSTAFTWRLWLMAVRTTARTQGFIPGASPPLVKTPMQFITHSLGRLSEGVHFNGFTGHELEQALYQFVAVMSGRLVIKVQLILSPVGLGHPQRELVFAGVADQHV